MDYSNRYLSAIFDLTNKVFDKFDNNDTPLKRILDSKMAFALLDLKRSSATDNFRIFSDFFSFAFREVNYTHSTNYLDLFVAFLFDKQPGVFLELGYCSDMKISCTQYLEGYCGWRGFILEYSDENIAAATIARNVEVLNTSSFRKNKSEHDSADEHGLVKFRVDFVYVSDASYLSDLQKVLNCCEQFPSVIVFGIRPRIIPKSVCISMSEIGYTSLIPEFFDGFTIFVMKSLADPYFDFKPYPPKQVTRQNKENFELLSVHIPKCAGTSMTGFLKEAYANSLHLAYDKPPGENNNWFYPPITLGSRARCVHGHIRIADYLDYSPKFIMTMLRDPIERIVSYYVYFKTFEPDNNLVQSMYSDTYSGVVEFARLIGCDYQLYLNGIDKDEFAFVGITENYTHSLNVMRDILNLAYQPGHEINSNTSPTPDIKSSILQDAVIVGQLKDILRQDISIYDYFVDKFHC